ncbi:MAG: phosphatase PAP2 family protein [Bacteroidota bacterium]
MQKLGTILSSHRVYFFGYALSLILFLLPQLSYNQKELFLLINEYNSPSLDFKFYWLTHVGDGLAFTLLIVVLLFFSYSKALIGLITFLSTSLLAQIIKRGLFSDAIRPFGELSTSYNLHVPDGVTTITFYSFPSGHTVTAFAIATFVILSFPNKKTSLLVLLIAWLVGYSRIYLTHHYPIDVWVGSIIGTLGALLIYWLFATKFDNKLGNRSVLNR